MPVNIESFKVNIMLVEVIVVHRDQLRIHSGLNAVGPEFTYKLP
jgi:hypothetical protein